MPAKTPATTLTQYTMFNFSSPPPLPVGLELTWFELRVLGIEIGRKLRGYYINNVYPAGGDSVVIRFKHPSEEEERLLVINPGAGLWVTDEAPRVLSADDFVRRLRQHVNRCRFVGIEAPKYERIVKITLDCFGTKRELYIEFFGRGNVVVVEDGVVRLVLNEVEGKRRTIKPGVEYTPPAPVKPLIFSLSGEELRNAIRHAISGMGDKPIERALGSSFLAPRKYLEEAIWRCGIEKGSPVAGVLSDAAKLDGLVASITMVGNELFSSERLVLYQLDGERELSVIRLLSLEASGANPVLCEEASECFKNAASTSRRESPETRPADLDRVKDEIERLEKRLSQLTRRSSLVRGLADELMRNPSLVLDDSFRNRLREAGIDVKELGNKVIVIAGRAISLDRPYSVASRLFEIAKKIESGVRSMESRREALVKELSKLRQEPRRVSNLVVIQARRKKWYERYRWFLTSEGLLAVGGRDASSNMAIIRKHLNDDDLVFHADITGSPFFVLKGGGVRAGERSINEVAEAVASFSRAWREGLLSVDVYYVKPSQVSLKAPSGEYLAKGSFMVYGKRNYVKGVGLRLGVGLIEAPDDGRSLVAAPLQSMHENGYVYVVITPGHLKPSDLAKKLIKLLTEHLPPDYKNLLESITLDDVVRVLPPGNSRVVGVARGKRLRPKP